MAPNDQMSIGVEYLAQPSRISGALVKEGVDCREEEKEDRGLIVKIFKSSDTCTTG